MNIIFRPLILIVWIATAVMGTAISNAEEPNANQADAIMDAQSIPTRPQPSAVNCPTPTYPTEAVDYELEGAVVLKFLIGEDGKVKNSSIDRSSGWKILDNAASEALSKCEYEKFEKDGKPSSYWTAVRYVWKMDPYDLGTKPVLLKETCLPLDKLSFASTNDTRADILLRLRVTSTGKPFDVKKEKGSGSFGADLAAIRLIQSCQFSPSIFHGQPKDGATSIRFYLDKRP